MEGKCNVLEEVVVISADNVCGLKQRSSKGLIRGIVSKTNRLRMCLLKIEGLTCCVYRLMTGTERFENARMKV